MCCSRGEAYSRLLSRWLTEVERHPGTEQRLPLTLILNEENIAAVAALDLYQEYSPAEQRRAFRMLDAWIAPQPNGPRQ